MTERRSTIFHLDSDQMQIDPVDQSERCPLRHLLIYGNTNKYKPVKKRKASGATAMRPTEVLYFFSPMATMLTMRATVKAIENQRWVCRIHLFQFNSASSSSAIETSKNVHCARQVFVTPRTLTCTEDSISPE